MSRSTLKLLTFDAVNTIIKVSPCPAKQYAEAAKKFGMKVEEQSIRNVYELSSSAKIIKMSNFKVNCYCSKIIQNNTNLNIIIII